LAQEPARFVENAAVKAILDRSDGDELPAIVVGDKLVASGRYPSRDELAVLLNIKTSVAPVEMTEQIKELIALGVAIGVGSEPCFKSHYDNARKQGSSIEVIREAVSIGEAVKAVSAKNILGLADRMIGEDKPKATSSSCCGGSTKTRDTVVQAKCCG
jgi:AhpD family alkylhydroperoxidase